MSISRSLRKYLIGLTGYWIYKRKHLPVGTDLKEDLTGKFNIYPELIFDIGAHYGETAIFYRGEFPNAIIYSFEPVRQSFETLVKNTQNDSKIKCFHTALGEREGTVEISLYNEYYSPMNSLKHGNPDGKKETVNVVTLNDFVRANNIPKIDLLKIDTEGYEIEVLKGGESILSKGMASAIIAECALSTINKRNTQLHELIIYLEGFGYYFTGLYDSDVRTLKQGTAYANALFINSRL